ncbi:response regulator [Sphingomonas sp.]|uniref:response regulator n=1 Tax=Sphingomonas sp. TaxID=28214 RepID=UPI000DB100FA|nr:response regulator [Sphingomonas sp.]PZU09838.1 MAG: DNA-binding response regulator [Sphingomonas sp.]
MSEDKSFIAVVEDDPEIGALVTGLLKREGFEAELCRDAAAFDRLRDRRRIDLAILDLMLPGEDGLSICRRLRAEDEIPILMVTAKAEDVDRIVGLEIGADDYLAKPFNPRELLARARSILRRTRGAHRVATIVARADRWSFAGMTLDAGARTLTGSDGKDIPLTGAEFDMLAAFVTHPQRVLSRDQLLDWTRGRDANPFDRSVDVMVGKVRRQLSLDPNGGDLIKTVRGGGYLFTVPVDRT